MKRIFIIGSFATALLTLVPVFGQGVVKERQENQKERIQAGVKDGSLTKAEAARLKAEQAEIRQDVRKQRKDGGEFTNKEKAKVLREQNKASKDIAKQRHDKQTRKQ